MIDVQKKRRRNEGITSEYVRSYDNGWVFCRRNVRIDGAMEATAIKSLMCLGLDFGAVDMIDLEFLPLVLEVNTAPGIEGTTIQKYADAIRGLL